MHAARVLIRATAGAVVLKVEDDGCGFVPDRRETQGDGIGLAGMSMRARRLGGRLAIESAPGDGATITADLPLGAAEPSP